MCQKSALKSASSLPLAIKMYIVFDSTRKWIYYRLTCCISYKNRMLECSEEQKMEFPCNSFRLSKVKKLYEMKRRRNIFIYIWNKILYCSLSNVRWFSLFRFPPVAFRSLTYSPEYIWRAFQYRGGCNNSRSSSSSSESTSACLYIWRTPSSTCLHSYSGTMETEGSETHHACVRIQLVVRLPKNPSSIEKKHSFSNADV